MPIYSEYVVQKSNLTAIADLLREKTGQTNLYRFPQDYLAAIRMISGGGGGLYMNPVLVEYATNADVPIGSNKISMEGYRQRAADGSVSSGSLYVYTGPETSIFHKNAIYILEASATDAIFSPGKDEGYGQYLIIRTGGYYYLLWFQSDVSTAVEHISGSTVLKITSPYYMSNGSYSTIESLWEAATQGSLTYIKPGVPSFVYARATGNFIDITEDVLDYFPYSSMQVSVLTSSLGTSVPIPRNRGAISYNFTQLFRQDDDIVENLVLAPTVEGYIRTPSTGKIGFSQVQVLPVTYTIDSDITAGNIRRGVNILGITGTYDGRTPLLQRKTVNGSINAQTISYDAGYDGLSSVTVSAPPTISLNIKPTQSQQIFSATTALYNKVIVQGISDPYLQSQYIKNGITILGVTGTYTGGSTEPTGTLYLSDLNAKECYTYRYARIEPNRITNLNAANIKRGVTILGVTGTYYGEELLNSTYKISTLGTKTVYPHIYAEIDVANITNLKAANIKKGTTILGITGTYEPTLVDTTFILSTTSTYDVAQYRYAKVDTTNLIASNIKEGIRILGITGTYNASVEAYGTARAAQVRSGYTVYDPTVGRLVEGQIQNFSASTEYNIEAGQISIRVPTAGKYCPSDIIVSAAVQQLPIILGASTPQSTYVPTQSSGFSTVTVAINSTDIRADYIRYGHRILGIDGTYRGDIPTASMTITKNGTYDVTNYATAIVDCAGDTSKATATAAQILAPFTAYTAIGYTTGTMQRYTGSTTINVNSTNNIIVETAQKYVGANLTIAPVLQQKTVILGDIAPTVTTTDSGYAGLLQVNYVINPEAIAGNVIRKGYTILGIEGTFDGTGLIPEQKEIDLDFTSVNKQIINPTTVDNYLAQVLINKPEALISENIVSGVTIAGVNGSALVPQGNYTITHNGEGIDIARFETVTVQVPSIDPYDATATADDILFGKTAYINTGKTTGTIHTFSGPYNVTLTSPTVQILPTASMYLTGDIHIIPNLEDINYTIGATAWQDIAPSIGRSGIGSVHLNNGLITPGNIKEGITILGIEGTVHEGITPSGSITITENANDIDVTYLSTVNVEVLDIDTSDATATADTILFGYKAYGHGQPIYGAIVTYDYSYDIL